MKTLLLIGGTGFFGKSFLDYAQRQGMKHWGISKIIVAARNTKRLAIECPQLIDRSIELYDVDVSKAHALPDADYVIHMAASSNAQDYIHNPQNAFNNMFNAVDNFCKIAEQQFLKSKILFVSSGAVYGTQPINLLKIPEDFFSTLDDKELSENKKTYTLAKRHAERAIEAFGKLGGNVAIARCFAFIGHFLPRNQHFAIGNFIEDGLHHRPIIVKAASPVIRSYMYADDLVEWLMTIVEKSSPQCPIYNVGSDEAITVHDLAARIAAYFGVDVKHPIPHLTPIDRYVPSIALARKSGMQINYKLDLALHKTIERLQQT